MANEDEAGAAIPPNRVIILHAKVYDFEDQQTKKRQFGTSLHYFYPDVMETDEARGCAVFKESITGKNLLDSLPDLPGIYDLRTTRVPGYKGKPEEKICGVKFVAPFNIP
jgi:hypothetical protein